MVGEEMTLVEGTEEFEIEKKKWEDKLNNNEVSFNEYVSELMDYKHDFGSLVHAISFVMIKAFRVTEYVKGPLTEYQKACLYWVLTERLLGEDKVGRRLQEFSCLCFPQYENLFNSIPKNVWDLTRAFAQSQLDEHGPYMLPSTRSHMTSIVEGNVPFGLKVEGDAKEVKVDELPDNT